MKFYKILFFNTLVLGTLITISSYSWLSMWMGLEINLLSIIPLLKNSSNIYPSEAAFKYFITQALASNIFLFSIIMSLHFNQLFTTTNIFYIMILTSSLFLKIGAAPFHFWFPEVVSGLNWNNTLIMLTWQKIAPMVLLMYNISMNMYIMLIIILSSLIGGIQSLNQTNLRKILAYSSINHIGWMIASMLYSQTTWLIYFLIYSMITLNIYFIFNKMNIYNLNQLFNMLNSKKMIKMIFILNFLSLSGLPPFLGFYPKWITLNFLMMNNFITLSIILVIFTLISMYMYLRISFSTLTLNFEESMIKYEEPQTFIIMNFNLLTLSSLIICTLIFDLS